MGTRTALTSQGHPKSYSSQTLYVSYQPHFATLVFMFHAFEIPEHRPTFVFLLRVIHSLVTLQLRLRMPQDIALTVSFHFCPGSHGLELPLILSPPNYCQSLLFLSVHLERSRKWEERRGATTVFLFIFLKHYFLFYFYYFLYFILQFL